MRRLHTAMKSNSPSLQLQNTHTKQWRPSTAKKKKRFNTALCFRLHHERRYSLGWFPFCLSLCVSAHLWNLATALWGKRKHITRVIVPTDSSSSGLSQQPASTASMWVIKPSEDSYFLAFKPLQLTLNGTEVSYPHWTLPKLQIHEQNKCCHCFTPLSFGGVISCGAVITKITYSSTGILTCVNKDICTRM